MALAIVGCFSPLPKDLCGIIKPHEQSVRIEMEDLFTGMGWDIRGEKDLEASPGLAVFFPGFYFFNFKAFTEEQERDSKIVPDCISSKI
jgi:hypothetical protein